MVQKGWAASGQALCQNGQQLVLIGIFGGGMEPFVTQNLVQFCIVCEANPQEHAQGPAAAPIKGLRLRVHILKIEASEEVSYEACHVLLEVGTIATISRCN